MDKNRISIAATVATTGAPNVCHAYADFDYQIPSIIVGTICFITGIIYCFFGKKILIIFEFYCKSVLIFRISIFQSRPIPLWFPLRIRAHLFGMRTRTVIADVGQRRRGGGSWRIIRLGDDVGPIRRRIHVRLFNGTANRRRHIVDLVIDVVDTAFDHVDNNRRLVRSWISICVALIEMAANDDNSQYGASRWCFAGVSFGLFC